MITDGQCAQRMPENVYPAPQRMALTEATPAPSFCQRLCRYRWPAMRLRRRRGQMRKRAAWRVFPSRPSRLPVTPRDRFPVREGGTRRARCCPPLPGQLLPAALHAADHHAAAGPNAPFGHPPAAVGRTAISAADTAPSAPDRAARPARAPSRRFRQVAVPAPARAERQSRRGQGEQQFLHGSLLLGAGGRNARRRTPKNRGGGRPAVSTTDLPPRKWSGIRSEGSAPGAGALPPGEKLSVRRNG